MHLLTPRQKYASASRDGLTKGWAGTAMEVRKSQETSPVKGKVKVCSRLSVCVEEDIAHAFAGATVGVARHVTEELSKL